MTSLETLIALEAPARLSSRDATLFSQDPAVRDEVRANLGWTHLAQDAIEILPKLRMLVDEIESETISDVVLLGMGGSSLASLVLEEVLGADLPGPRLHVLDTTSPITVAALLEQLELEQTLFLVSSKSGSTIEPLSLYSVCRAAVNEVVGADYAGRMFVALTDPGSPLEAFAYEKGFRAVIGTPADVGGRYSALTAFGLLPALLMRIDVETLLIRASAMEAACAVHAAQNPAALLAAFAVDATEAGKDKLTVVASPGLRPLGLWIEQLVAESLGKEGTGILPVVELNKDKPYGYGPDRAVVVVRFAHDTRLAGWALELRDHHPVHEIVLGGPLDIGAEFVRWEYAVALMGPLLGVNPFGQPNVAAAKAATAAVLGGEAQPPAAQHQAPGDIQLTFAGALPDPGHDEGSLGTAIGHAVATLEALDFLALLVYLPADETLLAPLADAVPAVSAELGVAVTLEVGPRYLHSTGQYHKGGPNEGVFVLVSTRDETDVEVPGQPYGLKELHRAQAAGDLITLADAGRRVLRIDLPDASEESVHALVRGVADAAGVVIEEQ